MKKNKGFIALISGTIILFLIIYGFLIVKIFNKEQYHFENSHSIEIIDKSSSNLVHPSGIISTEKHLILTDTGLNALVVLDLDGNFIQQIGSLGSGPSEFNFPTGICFFEDHYYIIDSGNHRVQILDKSFEYVSEVQINDFTFDNVGYTDIEVNSKGIILSTRVLVDSEDAQLVYIDNNSTIKPLKNNSIGCLTKTQTEEILFIYEGKIKEKPDYEQVYFKKAKIYSCFNSKIRKSTSWRINTSLSYCTFDICNDYLVGLRPNGTCIDFYNPEEGYMYTFPIVEYTDIWDKETYEATFYDMCNFEDNIYVVNNLGTLIKMTPSGDTK